MILSIDIKKRGKTEDVKVTVVLHPFLTPTRKNKIKQASSENVRC